MLFFQNEPDVYKIFILKPFVRLVFLAEEPNLPHRPDMGALNHPRRIKGENNVILIAGNASPSGHPEASPKDRQPGGCTAPIRADRSHNGVDRPLASLRRATCSLHPRGERRDPRFRCRICRDPVVANCQGPGKHSLHFFRPVPLPPWAAALWRRAGPDPARYRKAPTGPDMGRDGSIALFRRQLGDRVRR